MKKFITVLLSLSMVLSSLGTLAFAEGETASYKDGDLVWSEDFESYAVGYDYEANPTNGIYYANGGSGTATVKEDSTGNKYLYHGRKNDSNNYIFIAPAGDAISDNDEFTFDIDMKFDTIGGGAHNFGLGNTNAAYLYGAYASFNPTETNKSGNSGFEVQTERSVTSKFVQTVPGEDVQGNKVRVHANAWNTYRFIARKTEDGKYYADLYINGAYFYMIGTRTGSKWGGENGNNNNCFLFALPKSTTTACSVDNIKCYYGAVESNEYVTKGEVTVDRYTFDECTAGEYKYVNDVDPYQAAIAGASADHAFGVMRRYNRWGMNLDINSGKAGKVSGDNSLSVHSGGRVMFTSVNTDADGNTAAYSTRYGTWVPEGDSLEFSADVLFKDLNENWLFQLTTAVGSRRVAIEVTPTFYSTGHWQNPDDFKNNRQRIVPRIPVNTWVNLRVIITRGTSDTYNKLTIYADDQVVCEDVEITNWYSSKDNAVVTTDAAKGDALAKGFSGIYFNGECDYDNITIKKYLLGQPVPAPAAVPAFVNTSTKVNDYPSVRGKVYTDGRTIQNVVDAFGITGDFVVRDANGNAVTDYTQTADGKYIEIKANGKKYYGAFAANNVVENIDAVTTATEENPGVMGGFTYDATAVSAETVTANNGRDDSDTSILIKNNNTIDPEAETVTYGATDRFTKTLNTDENAYMEFSVLADENTELYVGYTMYLVRNGNTEGYANKLGAPRAANEVIKIANGQVIGRADGTSNNIVEKLIGTYKNNEWVKVRIEWNPMNDNFAAVSVNDGEKVLVNKGPFSYFKTIREVSITPAKGTSAIIDDIVVMEGIKATPTAAYITDITENYVYNNDNVISIAADYSTELMPMQMLGNSFAVAPVDAGKVWLKADGTKATQNTDNVARLVLVNDGVYTYYTIENRAGITEFKNEDGTSTVVVDVTNLDVVDLSKAKLISAVYNTDGTLSSVVLNDLVFDKDTYTCEIDITPQTFDAKTQTITYFAWDMNELQPLCDSLE